MMMKERFKANNRERPFFRVAALAVFLALFIAFGTPLGPLARDLFVVVLSAPEVDTEYALLSKDILASRLRDAERELSRVRYQSALFTLLAEENTRLRQAARAVALSESVTARVIARPPRTHYDSLLIDRGDTGGIAEDDLVVFEGIALGRVASVGARSATVELFSSPGSERDALVGDPVAVSIARGLGGGAFELSVPQEVAVSLGDVVRFPASQSFVLGVVAEISFEPTDVSKTVRFAAPVSFAELDFVHVLTVGSP